jgi:hypothetical protein
VEDERNPAATEMDLPPGGCRQRVYISQISWTWEKKTEKDEKRGCPLE